MTHQEYFAEEVEAVCGLRNAALVRALAEVPRERFLGPGPWMVRGEGDMMAPPRLTPDADPRRVYHNVSIAIDAGRHLFNGAPGVVAAWIDALNPGSGARVLHVGCGTGYYSAVLGAAVGSSGHVDAIEIDADLAARAREALAPWPWVAVSHDAGTRPPGSYDAILVNAGVTGPQDSWLDALASPGRMVLPLTVALPPGAPVGKGVTVLVARDGEALAARAMGMVAIYNAQGGLRDPAAEQKLGAALRNGSLMAVGRLRRDAHDEGPACAFHHSGFCFSRP